MSINKREKAMLIALVIVAVVVFLMPSDNGIQFENGKGVSKTVYNIVLSKFKYIKPFNIRYNKATKNNSQFTLKRNIFQYGLSFPDFNNKSEQIENKEQKQKEIGKEKQSEESGTPPIDFKIIGIISVKNGRKAIVITKGPELFVIKKGDIFFKKFTLDKVKGDTVTIGYIGFNEKKTIKLDNKGGF